MSGFEHFNEALFHRLISYLTPEEHTRFVFSLDKTMCSQVPEPLRIMNVADCLTYYRRRALSECIRETLPLSELDRIDRQDQFISLYAQATLAHFSKHPELLLRHPHINTYVNLWRTYRPAAFSFAIQENWRYQVAKRPHKRTVGGIGILLLGAMTSALFFQSFDPLFVGAALIGLWIGFVQVTACCARRSMRPLTHMIETDYQLRFLCQMAQGMPSQYLRATHALSAVHHDAFDVYVDVLREQAPNRFSVIVESPQETYSQESILQFLRKENALSDSVMIELLRVQANRLSSVATHAQWVSFVRYCKTFNFHADEVMRRHVMNELEQLPKRYGCSVAVGVVMAFFAAGYVSLIWFAHLYHEHQSPGLLAGYISSSVATALAAWPLISRWFKSVDFDENQTLNRQYRLVASAIGGLSDKAHAIAMRFRLGQPASWGSLFTDPFDDLRAVTCIRRSITSEKTPLLRSASPV